MFKSIKNKEQFFPALVLLGEWVVRLAANITSSVWVAIGAELGKNAVSHALISPIVAIDSLQHWNLSVVILQKFFDRAWMEKFCYFR